MTNPNNAVGTNGAFGGRTSVNAFNDVLALVSKGVVSGWACSPSSGMTVQLGGVAGTRDVAVAEDNAGNKTTVNNISGSPIEVTIANASTTDNMIDYIVAYVSNPPSGDEDVADNPSACGIISVRGASANTAPTASAIRSAITADGGTGTLAYYVVLAQISVTAGLTTITNDNISAVDVSGVGSNNIDWATIAPCWRGILSSTGATFATTRVNSRRVRIHVGFAIQNSSPSNIYLTSTNATGYCYWNLYGVRTDGFTTLSGENNNQSCIALCSPEAVARQSLHLHITLDLINYNGDGISWLGQIVIASAGGANNINGKIEFTLSEANNFGTLGILPLTATITNAEWTLEEFLYN